MDALQGGVTSEVRYVALDDMVMTGALVRGQHRLLAGARRDAAEWLAAYYEDAGDRAIAMKALGEVFANRRPTHKKRNLEIWGECRASTARDIFGHVWYRARQAVKERILREYCK